MRILLVIIGLLFTVSSFAHHDDIVGEGLEHELFHALLWLVVAVALYKGIRWLQQNRDR
ncbi:hypothetical protein KIH87_00850 [Paraneptunicella aestuarii]|uniref:hypothetical protein n=1 Tax=Paraneptunicella aestuarii TaxID=2831148 RepID=UPI001E367157|nr:hypothetical protein [Paraneptunicella aestuarii]UAA38954.1 hypothetical protein KIH87_00850 [Paraneptunicella aestuarii]